MLLVDFDLFVVSVAVLFTAIFFDIGRSVR